MFLQEIEVTYILDTLLKDKVDLVDLSLLDALTHLQHGLLAIPVNFEQIHPVVAVIGILLVLL